MKGMSKAPNFGKSIHDNGWGMFTKLLLYKLEEQCKKLIKIDKWYTGIAYLCLVEVITIE